MVCGLLQTPNPGKRWRRHGSIAVSGNAWHSTKRRDCNLSSLSIKE